MRKHLTALAAWALVAASAFAQTVTPNTNVTSNSGGGGGGGSGTVTNVSCTPVGGVACSVVDPTGAPVITIDTSGALTGTAAHATALSTGRTLSVTGDLTYTSPAFDGSANVTAAGTLASVVTAGTCTACNLTVDAKGRVTAAASGGGGSPGGSGTELQYRGGASTFSAVSGSAVTSNGGVALGGSTVTTSVPLVTATQTVNAAGVSFTNYRFNTNLTAAAAGSRFFLVGIDGTSSLSMNPDGDWEINKIYGAVSGNILTMRYQGGTPVAQISYLGAGIFNGGLSINGAFTVSTVGDVLARDTTVRHLLGTGTSPTVGGSCGSSPAIAGKDLAMQVTAGTGSPTSCTVTFGTAYTTAPSCTANGSATAGLKVATTTTTVIVSAASLGAGEVLNVHCVTF